MSINKLGHNWLQNCCRPICIWLISIGLMMLLHLGPLQNPPVGMCTICMTGPMKECTYWYHTTHGRVCPTGTIQPMEECALLVPHNPWRMCTTGTTTHGRVCTIGTTQPMKDVHYWYHNPWKSVHYWYHTTHEGCALLVPQPMEECALLVPHNPWRMCTTGTTTHGRVCTIGTTTHGKVYPTGTMQPMEECALLVPDNTWKGVPYRYQTNHGRVCPIGTTQPMEGCALLVPEKWNQHRVRKTRCVLKSYYSGSPQCSHWQCSPGWRGTPSLWCWARRLCTAPTPLNWAVCLHT